MNFTFEQREEAYEKANVQRRTFYDSPEPAGKMSAIAQKHLTNMRFDAVNFNIAVTDVALGLVPQEKLPDLLIERLQITRPEALKVTADVLDFLAPLGEDRPMLPQTGEPVAAPKPVRAAVPAVPKPVLVVPEPVPVPVEPVVASTPIPAEPKPAVTTVPAPTPPPVIQKEPAATPSDTHHVQAMRTMAHDMEETRNEAASLLVDGPGKSVTNPAAAWGDDAGTTQNPA